jgi:Flp pilus assembly protein CpaB
LEIDLGQTFCIKTAAKGKLNLALRSASAQLDENELRNAKWLLTKPGPAQVFVDVLRQNLNLTRVSTRCPVRY